MFSQRTNSQKLDDGLLADFRKHFPHLTATTAGAPEQSIASTADARPVGSLAPEHHGLTQDVFPDQDPTPRASDDPWRFTPSMMGNTAFGFPNPNGATGYYTPTPGGTNTLFHPQAGDLHTPSLALVGTPMSMPTSGDAIAANTVAPMDMSSFHALQPHQVHHFNPFIQVPPPQQQTFAPSSFVHQDTGYETMEQDGSPLGSDGSEAQVTNIDSAFHTTSPIINFNPPSTMPSMSISHAMPPSAGKFRFHSTLNAPTAMVKHADEVPITYLNKGQAYSISIADTHSRMPVAPGTRYRTFFRISFEDEEQRQKPSVCWGLWKEGRGLNEAHQRGGRLQAVEYVEAGQPAEGDEKRTRVEVESSSFDGFSIVWTPGTHGPPEVTIAVRFNFLSTDFSHSKGVKGIPVRLCAKTTALSVPVEASPPAADAEPEICYCKVKLFRDHGAERKLSNDIAHVKKSIDKLKQQIAQAETGMKDFGKRKRTSGVSKSTDPQRQGKVQKHKRTWSISSASSAGGAARMTLEEDLHFKLRTLQEMFTSTRPVSVLYLKAGDLDDMDSHPVSLPGDTSPRPKVEIPRDVSSWGPQGERSPLTDSLVSPSPSSLSLASQTSGPVPSSQWQNFDAVNTTKRRGSEGPAKVIKTDEEGNTIGTIEAVGVDSSYRPPVPRAPKPVACFYIHNKSQLEAGQKAYYRAIYLMERSLPEFKRCIAAKWGMNPADIAKVTRVISGSLELEIDDDVLCQLKEGQDMLMTVEDQASAKPQPTKREWEMAVDSIEETPAAASPNIIVRLQF